MPIVISPLSVASSRRSACALVAPSARNAAPLRHRLIRCISCLLLQISESRNSPAAGSTLTSDPDRGKASAPPGAAARQPSHELAWRQSNLRYIEAKLQNCLQGKEPGVLGEAGRRASVRMRVLLAARSMDCARGDPGLWS